MALNHGINTYKADTRFSTMRTGTVGIPYYIGRWPIHTVGRSFVGKPQLVNSFEEAVELGGYTTDWTNADSGTDGWSLCEAAYVHFKLFGMRPAVFYNTFDPSTDTRTTAKSYSVGAKHRAKTHLFDDNTLVVKTSEEAGSALVKNTDYTVYYENGYLMIELKSASAAYSATSLWISGTSHSFNVSSARYSAAIEAMEECRSMYGFVPDLIVAPGISSTPAIAALMAAKAASVNGLFKCKAIVDVDCSSGGADSYDEVLAWKNSNNYTDENMILCWPRAKVAGVDPYLHMSTLIAGLIAQVDESNGGVPYETWSNKRLPITGCCDAAGNDISLSIGEADQVSYNAGVVTALNFNGWRAWGSYTGCWPDSTDVAKIWGCTSRMQDYICNTFVETFWSYIDRPLTRVLIDAICNSFNSWLNGLTALGMLYGGELTYNPDNNNTADLLGGKFRLDCKMASPTPAQQMNMWVEFDVGMMTNALAAE